MAAVAEQENGPGRLGISSPVTIRAITSIVATWRLRAMISLTWAWLSPVTTPIWVWLAPVSRCAVRKTWPMSRAASASSMSGAAQQVAGSRSRSVVLPRMPLLVRVEAQDIRPSYEFDRSRDLRVGWISSQRSSEIAVGGVEFRAGP